MTITLNKVKPKKDVSTKHYYILDFMAAWQRAQMWNGMRWEDYEDPVLHSTDKDGNAMAWTSIVSEEQLATYSTSKLTDERNFEIVAEVTDPQEIEAAKSYTNFYKRFPAVNFIQIRKSNSVYDIKKFAIENHKFYMWKLNRPQMLFKGVENYLSDLYDTNTTYAQTVDQKRYQPE